MWLWLLHVSAPSVQHPIGILLCHNWRWPWNDNVVLVFPSETGVWSPWVQKAKNGAADSVTAMPLRSVFEVSKNQKSVSVERCDLCSLFVQKFNVASFKNLAMWGVYPYYGYPTPCAASKPHILVKTFKRRVYAELFRVIATELNMFPIQSEWLGTPYVSAITARPIFHSAMICMNRFRVTWIYHWRKINKHWIIG